MPAFDRITAAPVDPHATEVFQPMRDGVRLAADLYLPDGSEPGPTILVRLPYDKAGSYTFMSAIARYFTARDYRVLVQDVRGKFRSEGEALLFVNEVADGYDTIDWIAQQPWSDGSVAMWGDSYYGYTQWAAVVSGHPALKAIAPRVTGTMLGEPVHIDAHERITRPEWAVTYVYAVTHYFGNDTLEWEPDWRRRDFAAQVEKLFASAGARSLSYDQWYPEPTYLPRFPQPDPFTARPVPTLHTIGWWDNCAPLSWADVRAIAEHPQWHDAHHLRIEAVDHENNAFHPESPTRAADAGTDRDAAEIDAMLPALLDPALDFFEVYVRGNGSPDSIPRVSWALAGTDQHITSETWPPEGSRAMDLWASSDGGLTPTAPDHATSRTWVHDPANPVPSSVDDAFSYLAELPDEAPIGTRDDVLVFSGSPAPADVDLAGPVAATARICSSGSVMDLFVTLLDVAPDGTAIRIARGVARLNDATTAAEVTVDLDHVGYRLRAGHLLRVHVCSSSYPEYLPYPGTDSDPWAGGALEPTTQQITVGGPEGLRMTIPLWRGELT